MRGVKQLLKSQSMRGVKWLLTSQPSPVTRGGSRTNPRDHPGEGRGQGDSAGDRGIHPRSLLASLEIPKGPSRAQGGSAVPPPNPPGLQGDTDVAVVTFGARHAGVSPRSVAAGHQLGHQESSSAPSHVQPHEDPKSQKSPWGKGKGTCGFSPCLASGQQRRGKASRAPL